MKRTLSKNYMELRRMSSRLILQGQEGGLKL